MAHKMKEDEKIEKAIRALLKLPENRRCINCNSLGPQYVCTTFLTFICTNCSGIHREFTHRVKSVSMAKFTLDERARQIYFKDFDLKRHPQPDGSNIYKLRDFIKHVYVDRKYTGEKSAENLPRLRLSYKEDTSEIRKPTAYKLGLSSPSYEDRFERRYGGSPGGRSDDGILRYYCDERRSPIYSHDKPKSGGYRRNSARFEVVDDRFRDDDFGNGRRSSVPRTMSEESKLGNNSPDPQKKVDKKKASEAYTMRELSRGKSQSLKLRGAGVEKGAQVSSNIQKESYSRNLGPVDAKTSEPKAANSESLIVSGNPAKVPGAQPQQMPPPTNNGGNWATFDSSVKEKAPTKPPNLNTLESLLLELSVPAPVPAQVLPPAPASPLAPPPVQTQTEELEPEPEQTLALVPILPLGPAPESPLAPPPARAPTRNNLASVTDQVAGKKESTDSSGRPSIASDVLIQQLSLGPAPTEAAQRSGAESTVTFNTEQMPNTQQHKFPVSPAPLPASSVETDAEGPSTAVSNKNTAEASQNTPPGANSSARKEIPADLFTAFYAPVPAPVRGWHAAPPHSYGFNMQYYPNPMPYSAYPNPARSTNPFDVGDEPTQQPHGPPFPAMMHPQAGFVNMPAPLGPLNGSSLGPQPLVLRAPHSPSYVSTMQPQSPSHVASFPPGTYTGQEALNNASFSRFQGFNGFSNEGTGFASLNPNQQMTMVYSVPTTQNSPSAGGNPFG